MPEEKDETFGKQMKQYGNEYRSQVAEQFKVH